jgi:hypothetical protein
MPWFRDDDPEPLRAKRRELAEKERALAARMSELARELRDGPAAEARKLAEPPVWRLEDDHARRNLSETSAVRSPTLARQRRRDKIFFFLLIALLLVLTCIFFWIYQTHLRE